jgi:16S rRNA processing protein RimM
VAKTQGRHGEVAVDVLTDFPERFAERRRLFALDPHGARRQLRLENTWPHKERLVLKFEGVDSITEAEALLGCELQVPKSERTELEPGANYVADLVGCAVVVSGSAAAGAVRRLGTVADVQFGAGEAPLLVVGDGAKEYLIPFAAAYLQRLDTAAKIIEMALPEGMLDLDAPLSREEKDRQKGSS